MRFFLAFVYVVVSSPGAAGWFHHRTGNLKWSRWPRWGVRGVGYFDEADRVVEKAIWAKPSRNRQTLHLPQLSPRQPPSSLAQDWRKWRLTGNKKKQKKNAVQWKWELWLHNNFLRSKEINPSWKSTGLHRIVWLCFGKRNDGLHWPMST